MILIFWKYFKKNRLTQLVPDEDWLGFAKEQVIWIVENLVCFQKEWKHQE